MDNESGYWKKAVGSVVREVRATAKKKADGGRVPAESSEPVEDGQEYIKSRVLKELSAITSGMIEKAKGGATAPLKLLWELGKLHEDASLKRKTEAPSLGKLLMDEVRRKEAERKAEG